MQWNFDIAQAPRGCFKTYTNLVKGREISRDVHVPEYIIAAGNGGVVTVTHWNDKAQKWSMFTKDVPPLAWMPMPAHPYEENNDRATPPTMPV